MGIDVLWKSENGTILGEVGDPNMLFSRFVNIARSVPQSVCLRFLDPAGDACFNQSQIPFFAQELRQATERVGEPKLRAHLEAVLALAEKANGVHTYLWCIGD